MQNVKSEIIRTQISTLVREYAEITLKPNTFFPGVSSVPPSGKLLGAEEIMNLVDASLDGWLTTGRFNDQFERKLAAFLGIKHLITVNSGSSANLIRDSFIAEFPLNPGFCILRSASCNAFSRTPS